MCGVALDKIKFWLNQYIYSKNSRINLRGVFDETVMTDRLVFGHRIYDYLDLYYNFFINGDIEINRIDRRSMRQLQEHKVIMLKRFEVMNNKKYLSSEYLENYKLVLEEAQIVHNLQTKFNFKEDIDILIKIKENLKKLADMEMSQLGKIVISL